MSGVLQAGYHANPHAMGKYVVVVESSGGRIANCSLSGENST